MKYARLSRSLLEISRFGSRNGFLSNFYSTKAMPRPSRAFTKPREDSTAKLFGRISPVWDLNISIVPVLDQWVEEGRSVDEQGLKCIINQLRDSKRYTHALQILTWMTDKRYCDLNPSGVAIRLDLIAKTQGIEQAEIYFNSIPQKLKGGYAYGALLHAFANAKCVEKAETIMQKMRDLGYAKSPPVYNFMLNLYSKTGNFEKFDALLKEMQENGVAPNNFTLSIQLTAYAAVMYIEGIDMIVMMMESNPKVALDWNDYNVAATGYRKAGLLDKAFQMLKKAEARVQTKWYTTYNILLTQYATIGRKDEVVRVWTLYKEKYKYNVNNQGYKCVLLSFLKLDDIEMAEETFDEWESKCLRYDMQIPNIMMGAYSRKGLLEKAEALLERTISKGGKPNVWTWRILAAGYLQNQQPRKAVEMVKKAMVSETGWKPCTELVKACLEYLEGVGDVEQTEEFANLLEVKDRNITSTVKDD